MPHEDLARKIDTLAAVLEPTIGNTTDKDSALSAPRTAQAIPAATTAAILVCIAVAAIGAADGRQPSPMTIMPFHACYPLYRKALRGPSLIGGSAKSDRRWTRPKSGGSLAPGCIIAELGADNKSLHRKPPTQHHQHLCAASGQMV